VRSLEAPPTEFLLKRTLVRTVLHDNWTVRGVGGDVRADLVDREFAAIVPGCVTTDLLSAGVVPDPYLEENEGLLAFIGRTDWRYTTTFDVAAAEVGERLDLVCDGLDTVAMIEINGVRVGETANMHRSYRFDVRDVIRTGSNELAVTFAAPLTYAEGMSEQLGPRPHVNAHPFNAIRKMASNFGWDWGPDLPTAGIWRPIALERWREVRLASVRPLVDVEFPPTRSDRPTRGNGTLAIHIELEWANENNPETADLRARLGEIETTVVIAGGASSALVELVAPDVELWWPAGYGGQALYDLELTLHDPDDEARSFDAWRGRVGFRTVLLDTSRDQIGRRFAIVVNGLPIAIRGANWIPDDCFVSRIDRRRYDDRLQEAVAANMNMLRIWGGGIYESDDFYDIADELGLLIWQDFLFACAAYAEEEPLRSEIIAEASEAVTRLAVHPSLALWNGNNENIWGHEDWGWKEQLEGRTWGAGYYFNVLPEIVGRLDPSRPYSPGSPFSFERGVHPNDPSNGTMHVWDVWNQKDYLVYGEYAPRFVSEFGFQGPPTWSTLNRAVHDTPPSVDGPGFIVHQKATDGTAKLERGLAAHLPLPTSFEDWHWATSLNQARAVEFAVNHWRSLELRCAGTLVWQLNDCWPVTSWAAIDGDGRRKPLWFALRRSYGDRLLTFQPHGDGLALCVVNDAAEPWTAVLPVARQNFCGAELARTTVVIDVAPGTSVAYSLPGDVASNTANDEVLVGGNGVQRALHFYVEDVAGILPTPDLSTELARVDGGYELKVVAGSLQRDVTLLVDKVAPDAEIDRMLVTLLAGESTIFQVRCASPLNASELVSPRVLRSANQLVHPHE
jgi:beta-mannosidase